MYRIYFVPSLTDECKYLELKDKHLSCMTLLSGVTLLPVISE